jgi:hypothetical protein
MLVYYSKEYENIRKSPCLPFVPGDVYLCTKILQKYTEMYTKKNVLYFSEIIPVYSTVRVVYSHHLSIRRPYKSGTLLYRRLGITPSRPALVGIAHDNSPVTRCANLPVSLAFRACLQPRGNVVVYSLMRPGEKLTCTSSALGVHLNPSAESVSPEIRHT